MRLIAVFVLCLTGSVFGNPAVVPIYSVPVKGGDEMIASERVTTARSVQLSLDETYPAGTTYYDYQHNGTAGKMIAVDGMGLVHLVWMNGLDAAQADRHIYYNIWDPSTPGFVFEGGVQVNSSMRGGYACQVTHADGFCFPAWHDKTDVGQVFGHSASALDFLPQSGAFTTYEPDRLTEGAIELELDWPKIAMDRHGNLHTVTTENPLGGTAGTPQRIYYARGVPQYNESGFGTGIEWQEVAGANHYMLIDTVMVIAANIACSRDADRIVITWSKSRDTLSVDPSQYNNDLYMMISEDAGLNWGEWINVTDFERPDWDCVSQDTVECDKDTFRVYTDMTVILDEEDWIHIAFTSCYLYQLEGLINVVYSDVWHWGEEHQYFSNIAHGHFDVEANPWLDPGAWQRVVQRPSLALDPATDELFCSFQRYDTLQYSSQGWPQGEAYVARSSNDGIHWSEAVNVTNTDGGQDAAPGESLSERDITLSDLVTYEEGEGYLHMEYILDLDAGGIPQDEGTATLNPVLYHPIPIDDIPSLPLHDAGYPALRVDSTGYPPTTTAADHRAERPESFVLHQNYPNPFNPATRILFDLTRSDVVTLAVYNLMGQEVAKPLDHESMSAGVYSVDFDGSALASGVYVYRLEADGLCASRKMLLVK